MHHVAQFAGGGELSFAIHNGDFGVEDGAADFSPGQAVHQADFALFAGQGVAEFDDAEELAQRFRRKRDRKFQTFFHHFARHFPADIADFALQIANAGLAGVAADDAGDHVVGKYQILFC